MLLFIFLIHYVCCICLICSMLNVESSKMKIIYILPKGQYRITKYNCIL